MERFTPSQSYTIESHQVSLALRHQLLHHFAHILRVAARGDEQGIARIDYDQILHAQKRDELVRTVNVIAVCVDDESIRGLDYSADRSECPSERAR